MSAPSAKPNGDSVILSAVRRFLLVILLLGMLGTEAELVLTAHTEDLAQWIPVLLIPASLIALGWHAADGQAASLRVFQGTMILFLISGVAGIYLHYQGKVEFQLEMDPSLAGLALFWQAIRTQSPPALAPAVMIQLGLLGLAYTHGKPVFGRSKNNQSESTGA